MGEAITGLDLALNGNPTGGPTEWGLITNWRAAFQSAENHTKSDRANANRVADQIEQLLAIEAELAHRFLIRVYRPSLGQLARYKNAWDEAHKAYDEAVKKETKERVAEGEVSDPHPKVQDCALFGSRIWNMLTTMGRPPTPAELAPFPYKKPAVSLTLGQGGLSVAERKERNIGLLSVVEQLPGILTTFVQEWERGGLRNHNFLPTEPVDTFDLWMVLEDGDARLAANPAEEHQKWKQFYQSVCATCSLIGGMPPLPPPPAPVTELPVVGAPPAPGTPANPVADSLASEPYCGQISMEQALGPVYPGAFGRLELRRRAEWRDRCYEKYDATGARPTIVDQVLAELAAARLR